jgi:cytidylate kinase
MIIAIDGPAGSGKTTAAKLLAKRLDIFYLDTGATYRALTYAALREGIDVSDAKGLADLARYLPLRIEKDLLYLGHTDISRDIRTPHIDKHISPIVAHPEVREVMVQLQRNIVSGKDSVVEGRDITTVVFPQAEYKFYLDAAPEIRAKRRFEELQGKSIDVDYRQVRKDLEKRDSADRNRAVGSLKMSADAVCIDTSNLTIEETVEKIRDYLPLDKTDGR